MVRPSTALIMSQGDAVLDTLTSCYSELSNSRSEISLLEQSLRNATATNTRLHQIIGTCSDESQTQLRALRQQLSMESNAANQLPIAQAHIRNLEFQLSSARSGSQDASLRGQLARAQTELREREDYCSKLRAEGDAKMFVSEKTRFAEQTEMKTLDLRVTERDEAIRKLQEDKERLLNQVSRENAARLEDIRKIDIERAKCAKEIADLELRLQSRRGTQIRDDTAQVHRMQDELIDCKLSESKARLAVESLERQNAKLHEALSHEEKEVENLTVEADVLREVSSENRERLSEVTSKKPLRLGLLRSFNCRLKTIW